MIGERPTGCWWCKQATVPVRPRFSKLIQYRKVCELLANQQKDGDSPIQSIVIGLCERSRKGRMKGLRNFIEVDNHSVLHI